MEPNEEEDQYANLPMPPLEERESDSDEDDDDDDDVVLPAAVRKLLPHDDFTLDVVYKRARVSTTPPTTPPTRESNLEVESTEATPIVAKVPPSFRSLVENDSLANLIQSNCICRKCKIVGPLELTFPSVALATRPVLFCAKCGDKNEAQIEETTIVRSLRGHTKATDYAANVLCALSFLSSGDGGVGAQRVLGMLGLPHCQSMEKDAFAKIERAIAPVLDDLLRECLDESLIAEVASTMESDPEFDFDKWKASLEDGFLLFPHEKPEIMVSMDMGWQKKGSGRRFDSLSGHFHHVRETIGGCSWPRHQRKRSSE